jgi:S1-C subfamily serine protease
VRATAIVFVALVAAVLGAAAAVAVGKSAGWLDSGSTTTQVVTSGAPAPVAAPAAVRSNGRPLTGNGFDPARIYSSRSAGVVTIYSYFGNPGAAATSAAQGSGFVVSPNGTILTNSHVVTNAGEQSPGAAVKPAKQLFVEFNDHDRVPATIVGWDIFDDVGVIKVDPKSHALAPVPLGTSSTVQVGQPVSAIGSPLGNENSLAVGVVSGIHRSIASLTSEYRLSDAIQTDAPITHGNSGGPLFDARGRVIGINAQIRSASGSGNDIGVGFAVPIDSAKRSMAQLLAKGHVAYAYVGITTQDLTPSLARHFGYPVLHGAVVSSVRPGTAGAKAGLKGRTGRETYEGIEFDTGGDVITAIDGRPVDSADDVVRVVEQLSPGQVATLSILRGTRRLTIPVKLDERPANPE